MALKLSLEPDAYGFFYGLADVDNHPVSVNVLPPKPRWHGQTVLDGYEPDAEDWKLYIDGEEVGRVRVRDDAERVLTDKLALARDRGEDRD